MDPAGRRHDPLYTIPIAGVVTGIVGVLFGIPALRLAGVSLALATFAMAVALPRGEAFRLRHGRWRG